MVVPSLCLKSYCSQEMKAMLLVDKSFDDRHDQIHCNIFLAEIGTNWPLRSEIMMDFLEKAPSKDLKSRPEITNKFS